MPAEADRLAVEFQNPSREAGDLVFPVRGLDVRFGAYREQAFAVERVHVRMDVALDEARGGDVVVAWVIEYPESTNHRPAFHWWEHKGAR